VQTNKYHIRLSARIEIGGMFEGETAIDAIAAAERELRMGDILEIIVDQIIEQDDETDPMPDMPPLVWPEIWEGSAL
jgi:hypothetical protein